MQIPMSQHQEQQKHLRKVVLFTRHGCHLCEEAANTLAEYGLLPTIVDIDRDPALLARFDMCVPVIEIDGRIRFRGRVNNVLLRRILERD
jgi:glutaredoxin